MPKPRPPMTKEEFLRDVTEAQTGLDLWNILLRYCHDEGVQRVSYHHHGFDSHWGKSLTGGDGVRNELADVATSANPSFHIAAHGFPKEWVDTYVNDHLYEIDPIPDLARRTAEPFFWSETANLTRLADEQAAYLKRLDDSKVGDGVAIQVFGPNMRHGYVGFGFGDAPREVSPDKLAEFQMVAQLLHIRACAIIEDRNREDIALSQREREVIGWMARGKSKSVIADILGISVHTVDTTVRRIFKKLRVADRTSAVVKAVNSGLIPAMAMDVT